MKQVNEAVEGLNSLHFLTGGLVEEFTGYIGVPVSMQIETMSILLGTVMGP